MSRWFKKKCVAMPDFFHEGKAQVDGSLRKLEMCTAVVKRLCIYKAPLTRGPLQTVAVPIYHHFLVVEVSAVVHPDGRKLNGLLIRAEKAENGEMTGVTVQNVHFVDESDAEVHRSIDIADLCVRIPMRQLLAILTHHCPHYDFFADNCWKYADSTYRALVEAFRDLKQEEAGQPQSTHRQQEAAGRLSTHLQQMPTLVMPATQIGTFALVAATIGFGTVCLYKGLSAFFEREESEESEEKAPSVSAA